MLPSISLVEMASFLEAIEKRAQPSAVLEQAISRMPGPPELRGPVLTLAGLAGMAAEGPRNIYRRGLRGGALSPWHTLSAKGFHTVG
jgi:hypothetical protein